MGGRLRPTKKKARSFRPGPFFTGRPTHPVVPRRLPVSSYWQTSRPRGSGKLQFFVVPSCVMTNTAVALPS